MANLEYISCDGCKYRCPAFSLNSEIMEELKNEDWYKYIKLLSMEKVLVFCQKKRKTVSRDFWDTGLITFLRYVTYEEAEESEFDPALLKSFKR